MSAPRPSVLRGIVRLAQFRADGFAEFTPSRAAFLNSLAPLIAFPLVGAGLMLAGGGGVAALSDLLATAVALLGPPVISFALAAAWGRESAWLRYAVAFNWCQWTLPVVAVLLLMALGMLMRVTGIGQSVGAVVFLLGLLGYGLGLHWFLARRGLGLSGGRAAAFVVAVNLGTGLLVLGPRMLANDL
jgi:hypothetical protein